MEPSRCDAAWAEALLDAAIASLRDDPPWLGGSRAAPRVPGDPPDISNPSPRLTIVLEGRCRHALSRGGRRALFPGNPGQALFLAADAWNLRLAGEPTRFLGVVFARDCLRVLEGVHHGGPRTTPAPRWHHAAPLGGAGADVLRALDRRAEAAADPGPAEAHLVRALLLLARERCLAPAADAAARGAWPAVREHLHDHAHDPGLSRDGVARRFRIHPSHLSDLCARHGGAGFHALVERIRLDRARRLLTGGSTSVAEIMRACGYADAGTGIRAFRRVVGETPGAFRRRAR